MEVLGKVAIDHRQENECPPTTDVRLRQKIYCNGTVTVTMIDEAFRKELAILRFKLARRLIKGCTCNIPNKAPLVGRACADELLKSEPCSKDSGTCTPFSRVHCSDKAATLAPTKQLTKQPTKQPTNKSTKSTNKKKKKTKKIKRGRSKHNPSNVMFE